MSRTKRFIPTWDVGPSSFTRTMAGIYPWWEQYLKLDPRDRRANGYDTGTCSYHATVYRKRGYKEVYGPASRRYYKRFYHRDRRRYEEKDLQRWLNELE